MSDLTERRNLQTRTEIADAAVALFLERGFAETSMDDVAAAAGVSRRTAYRHFATKDDLVFEQPRRWFERYNEVIDGRREGEATRTLVRRALLAVAVDIAASADRVLSAYAVLVSTPALNGKHGASDQDWIQRTAALIFDDLDDDPDALLRAATASGALTGATNAVIAVWAQSPTTSDIVVMTETALDQLDSVWPDASR